MKPYGPIDLGRTKPYPIAERENLVDTSRFGTPIGPGATVRELLRSLPGFLGAEGLRDLAQVIARAHRAGRPVVFAMGAHVVKVGCGPLVADLVERGIVTACAVNGAFAIHDYEIAAFGETSEEVAKTIRSGKFGFARETAEAYARAAKRGVETGEGLGRSLGREVIGTAAGAGPGTGTGGALPNAALSVLGACARAGAPCCVHVAIGTDTVHMHAATSGAELGAASHLDFRILASVVCDLDGGVWVNIGSAVVLPEVFLKLVSIARNLGNPLADVTSANLDMLNHYRTGANVLARPVKRGISILGHHEILIPLLRLAILDALEGEPQLAEKNSGG